MYCLERETGKGETVHVIVVHFMGMGGCDAMRYLTAYYIEIQDQNI